MALRSIHYWLVLWLDAAEGPELLEWMTRACQLIEDLPVAARDRWLERILGHLESSAGVSWPHLALHLSLRLGPSRSDLLDRLARMLETVPLPFERLLEVVLRPLVASPDWQQLFHEVLATGEADRLLVDGGRLALLDRGIWLPAASLLTSLGPASGLRLLAVIRDRLTYLTLRRFLPWFVGSRSSRPLSELETP